MRLAVDRPRPVNFEHRGIQTKIAPAWDIDDDSVPAGVYVHIDHADWKNIAAFLGGPFASYDEAVLKGKELAVDRIEHLFG